MFRRRYFGNTVKSLLHFDFPYNMEPDAGLRDEISSEIWSNPNSVKFAGNAAPVDVIRAGTPKFGYQCPYFEGNSLACTNNTGIFTIHSNRDYEISFFINLVKLAAGNILAFKQGDIYPIVLAVTNDGALTLAGSASETKLTLNTWQYIVLRISGGKSRLFIDGAQVLEKDAVSCNTDKFLLGGFYGLIDEFVLKHSAVGSAEPPNQPLNGILDAVSAGGFGTSRTGRAVIGANNSINTYGMLAAGTSGTTCYVENWTPGYFGLPQPGDELLFHVSLSRGNQYDCTGFYAFRNIASISGNRFTIDRAINDEFNLGAIKGQYYIQVVTVPHFSDFTINEKVTVSPIPFNTKTGGGIVIFRASGTAEINGSIYTHNTGTERAENITMCHSELIDRFILSSGGNIFIAAGTLNVSEKARLGGTQIGSANGGRGTTGKAALTRGGDGGAGYGGSGAHGANGSSGHSGIGWGSGNNDYPGAAPGQNALYACAGANVIIIADKLNLPLDALSTGGHGGVFQENIYTAGAGTGFAYISAKELLS